MGLGKYLLLPSCDIQISNTTANQSHYGGPLLCRDQPPLGFSWWMWEDWRVLGCLGTVKGESGQWLFTNRAHAFHYFHSQYGCASVIF